MNLLNSQTKAIEKLSLRKVGALFKRPGTGKSRTTLELIKSVPKGEIDIVLWLAPFKSVNPIIAESGIRHEVDKWEGVPDIPIIFYGIESLSNSDRIYFKLLKLVQENKVFIVCDESLKIKNYDAKRTKRIIEIGKHCEYKLILNGTPISRNLLDVWPQMEFLSSKILAMDMAQFKNTFCEYTKITKRFGFKTHTKEFITKYHNIDYLYSLIRQYVYEADLNLEIGKQHIDVSYCISEEEKEEYNQLKEKYLDNEKLAFLNNNIFLEMTMKMQHIYSCSEEKFDACKTIIEKHGPENVIIFCKFVDGRKECKKRFPNVTILSIQSDSMSINMQSKHVTIEFDKTWNFADVDQYQHRTYRVGQQHTCYYYYLEANTNLDGLIKKNNAKKFDQLIYFKTITKEELKQIL